MHGRLPILDRRTFLGYSGASLALAGLGGCKPEPAEKIVPFSETPPELIPGIPTHYATSLELDGYGRGLLVQTREGRPIKVEGHPEHPINRGAAGPFEQASLMDLYDDGRAGGITKDGEPASWSALVSNFPKGDGEGLCLLLEPTGSPSIATLLEALRRSYPRAKIFFHSAFAPTGRWEATEECFGRAAIEERRFEDADVVLSLDADFLTAGPTWLSDAREFAARRRPIGPNGEMNRLYVAECGFSATGAKADHRIALRSNELLELAHALVSGDPNAFSAHDLFGARGRSLVIAGDRQPKAVHALALALNARLGNIGKTVVYRPDPILEAGESSHELAALAEELSAGRVQHLVIIGGDPAFTAPADFDFAALIRRARHSFYLGLHDDDTARACEWRIAETHPFESWGDARAADGTITMIQPLIRPLFGGRTRLQLLAALIDRTETDARKLLEQRWGPELAAHLRSGWIANSAFEPITGAPKMIASPIAIHEGRGLELAFLPSASLHDGRYARNAWLQELPDAMTRLCWGNAVLLAPATARRLEVARDDLVRISSAGRSVDAPVFVMPGLPEDFAAIALGHGSHGVGVDAFPLRTRSRPWFVPGVRIEALGDRSEKLKPACVQEHGSMEGRAIVLSRTADEYRSHPDFAEEHDRDPVSIHADWPESSPQWGMAIDLNACVGCNACVTACQAENNVPTVGKLEVQRSREMHWLRLDRYYLGDENEAEVVHQPMLCQHCEKAPCEYVCPVNATVHSPDGLNEMVYNRCVGTRFCSNNCPYKVRRFNWFDFNGESGSIADLHYNPDVTVRARGVMEKCTYCVQRIRRSQHQGTEPVTACQQACPAEAIVFGDLTAPDSKVKQLFDDPRTYAVMNELGTRPRTRYLAVIRNKSEDE
jgi:Fe-S-cluster-containing dehydrogenase component